MKQALLIGSVTVDVLLPTGHLPAAEEDLNLPYQIIRPGGCAFNAASVLRLLRLPFTLAFPLGTGLFAAFLEKELDKRGIAPFFRRMDENGACYCLIDGNGNRSFLAVHGAEYHFEDKMFDGLNPADFSLAYASGIDLEEDAGEAVVRYLESLSDEGVRIFFAPGPRAAYIPDSRLRRVLALHPVLHLNRTEACQLSSSPERKCSDPGEAARTLAGMSGACVIVTGGASDVICCTEDGKVYSVPPAPAEQKDGTGAGDCHAGMIMAAMICGTDPLEAVPLANLAGAAAVRQAGGELTEDNPAARDLKKKASRYMALTEKER